MDQNQELGLNNQLSNLCYQCKSVAGVRETDLDETRRSSQNVEKL